jgi:hypothetical protein
MKKAMVSVLFLVVVGCLAYWIFFKAKKEGPKPVSTTVLKHSKVFNASIDAIVSHYLSMKDAFVEGDTGSVKKQAELFITAINKIDTVEMKKDTVTVYATLMMSLENLKQNATSILQQSAISEMRRDFFSLSSEMYPGFFKLTNYEGKTLYQQNCPMAFGENDPASWISDSRKIVNPYLGKNHPEHKSTMLHCGELMDSVYAK